jgi:NAD(P)H-hydrate epimerase
MNVAVKADVTVTFGVNKFGLAVYPGCRCAGEVIVGDIGYPKSSYEAVSHPAYYYEPNDLPDILPLRRGDGHKGTFGHVGIIGGCREMCGAVTLAAKAAYAAGAGLVRVVSSQNNREIVLGRCLEAIFGTYECDSGKINEDELNQTMEFADVMILGPGLGRSELAKNIVHYVLERFQKPLIVDGDAIALLQTADIQNRDSLILTPHPKEFSHLLQVDCRTLKTHFLQSANDYAKEIAGVLVAKDARTIVSDGTSVYLNVSGNSGMGTGGSGDVLTGVIAAFAAQGLSPFEAAKAGVYVHGLAGDYFAERYNEYSLTASDLTDSLKYILQKGFWEHGGE